MPYKFYDKIDVHYSLIFYNYELLLFPEQRELSVHNCVELYQVQYKKKKNEISEPLTSAEITQRHSKFIQ